METLTERVHKGAALLDRKASGWRDRVRAEALDVSNPMFCVLGQVFGAVVPRPNGSPMPGYRAGAVALFGPPSERPDEYVSRRQRIEAHGFLHTPDEAREIDWTRDDGDPLTQAWVEYLSK